MANGVSYSEVFSECRSRDNFNEIFMATISNKWSNKLNLSSVKSCLTVGPGDGIYEIAFIKQCVANTSKFIAVEPDHESAERLRTHLAESLPSVGSQVIETKIESWKGLDDQVDLVLLMNLLYYVQPNERKELYKKMHEQWLATGGRVVVVTSSRTKYPGNYCQVFVRLGKPLLAWEDIESELLEAGFIEQYADEIQGVRDLDIDGPKYLLLLLRYIVDRPVTLDEVRGAVEELFPGEKCVPLYYTLAVFEKA